MARYLSIDWETDDLTGVEASVADGRVRIHRCFNFAWPNEFVAAEDPKAAGEWLSASLKKAGIETEQALVVVPRHVIVVRRLELPNAPDEELPDLVRFQAATKSSTPLDRLALDYVPIPIMEGDVERDVLMVTIDNSRLKSIRNVFTAAGLELAAVGISPVGVAELVTRIEGEHSADPHQATLVVFQDTHRVEITVLQQHRVVFTHQTQLRGSDDAGGIRSSIVEINRASVALSQSQHDVKINEVCLIHAGDADPALEQALGERFGGQLHVLDVASARGLEVDSPVDRTVLAAFAPAVGMLLSHREPQVPSIDFLNPRRRIDAPDRTRLQVGLVAAGLLLAVGVGYGLFRWHLANIEQQRIAYESEEAELKRTIKAGAPELAAAANIGGWTGSGTDPLSVLDRIEVLSPGTDRLYFKEYEQIGGNRETLARISGMGYSKSSDDVEQLQETLEQAGYRVLPNPPVPSRVDPDYPFEFRLEIHILRQPDTTEAG